MDNQYQQRLWQDLMRLSQESEAFYYQDFEVDNTIFRIFNYRLTKYTDFLEPNALESRGTMFEVVKDGLDIVPVRLACLPMEKFFNINENPLTQDLDLSKVIAIEVKKDGSLMSTYNHRDRLYLKSKKSIESEQCKSAMHFLANNNNIQLYEDLRKLTASGYTVNLEWCAPYNRVILNYDEARLVVLNARHILNGRYLPRAELIRFSDSIYKNCVEEVNITNVSEFMDGIPNMKDIEGFIFLFESEQRAKIKTLWYLNLHALKESVESSRRLFECIVDEKIDDVKSFFHDDEDLMERISKMEERVDKIHNHLVNVVEKFYEENKDLGRKDYALLGQEELDKIQFGCAMSLYLGKKIDYKEVLKKIWKNIK